MIALILSIAVAASAMSLNGLPDIVELEARTETINATVATDNNGLSAYWIYGPVSGPRVVLVMGLAYSHYMWESTIIDLSVNHGWRVLALDNRGAGKSATTPGPYTTTLLANDVKTVLRHAGWLPPGEDPIPPTPIHLVGISMGGMIIQELALSMPNTFASLALTATYHGGNFFQTLPSFNAIMNLVEILLLGDEGLARQARLLYTNLYLETHEAEVVTSLAKAFTLGGAMTRSGLLAQVAAIRAHDTRDRLKSLKGKLPIVVLVGSEDVLISPKRSQAIAKDLGCPIHILEGAGHGLTDDWSAGDLWYQAKLFEHLAAAQATYQ